MESKEFEVCIRGVIRNRGKILVCQHKEKKIYFFPGGHIKFGESIRETILREFKEELGILVKKFSFIGAMENIYTEEGVRHHEFNLVFNLKVGKFNKESRENHIDFLFFDIKRFSREKILPIALQKAISKWLKDKKMF